MLPAVLYAGLFGMLFGLVALGVGGVSPRVPARDLLLALAMGVVQLGGGLVVYTRASRHLPAAELQLVATAELVLAPLRVWIGVGEAPGAATVAGIASSHRGVDTQNAAQRPPNAGSTILGSDRSSGRQQRTAVVGGLDG